MKVITTLLFAAFFLSSLKVSAQETTRVTVQDNQDMQRALNNNVYRFPNFRTGTVTLANGKQNTVKLNFNMLLNQMQFIDENKDTLTILYPELLESVQIDSSTFVHHKNGFLELIGDYFPVMLAVGRKVKIADRQQHGAYGTRSSSASISTTSTGYGDNIKYSPNVYEDVLVKTDIFFYLIDEESNVTPFNKRSVFQLYPQHKDQITKYIKDRNVDFKNEKDVIALLTFASEL